MMICNLKFPSSCTIYFVLIYRPPSSSITEFLVDLTSIFESISSDNTIILGDFNIQYNRSYPAASSLKSLINEFSLTQHILFPTNTNGNCIDLVISPSSSDIVSSPSQSFLISDHFVVTFELILPPSTSPRPERSFRKISAINIPSFVNSIFSRLYNPQSLLVFDSLYDNFNAAISNSLEIFAPVIKSINRSFSKSPWFNNELVNLRRTLRKLQNRYQVSNLESDLKSFKVCRSLYRTKLITLKSSYFTDKLNNFGMSSKQAFQLSFKLIGRDQNRRLPDHSDSYLCTAFSNFFQRKISNVIDSLPRFDVALFDVTFITSSNHWSCFTLPSQAFVLSLVTSLKSHSPLDPVPLVLLRSISPYIIGLITNIINVSLITSTVPQSMKHSYITPLLKKPTLDHSNLTNYRPISQLSSISKTLERVVSTQLIHYITTNNIADCFQSAYLPHRSTETALNLIFSDILLSLDTKCPCYLILLDLSCAFDSLNLTILSYRLREIGINGQVLNWFMSFVSNRTSSVKINSSLSQPFTNSYGVPQGSVLGPILFIIYILPIRSIFLKYPHLHYHLYADDLQIYTSFPPSCNTESIQLTIYELITWFSTNSLSLNMAKTNTIILSRSSSPLTISFFTLPSYFRISDYTRYYL